MLGFGRKRIESFTATEVAERRASGEIVLVDVREAVEFARGHIEGAIPFPLSTFDPGKLPEGALMFYCAVGRRSAVAAESARKAGANVAGHMGDGLTGWVGAGLPIVTR